MRITITGNSGFVGQNLQRNLQNKFVVDTLSVRYFLNQVIEFDTDAIIHLAGKAHDVKNVSNPLEYYESNYELTKQLFDSFLNSKATVFIFMSTVKAVADEVNGALTEDDLANPKTHYGISKRKAEQYILSKNLPLAKRIYILRPCMIHGPGNKGNLNLLYQLVSKGFPWPLGDFQNKRSFLSIENLCFVINELLNNTTIPSGVYNVADSETLSTNDLILLLGKSFNKRSVLISFPSFLIKKIAVIGDYLHLPLNTERLQKLTESYIVDNSKIISAIGKQLPVHAADGLLHAFKSFKNKK